MRRNQKTNKSIVFIFLFFLPFLTHYFIPIMVIVQKPYSYLGSIFMIAGLILAVESSRMFKAAGNHYDLKSGSAKLITSGIFLYSRNPMYLGVLFWLIGLGILLGSLISFLYPIIFFILANIMIILEEKKLINIYGDTYMNYRRSVRRWF